MAYTTENPFGTGTDAETLEMWKGYLHSIPIMGVEREIRGRMIRLPDADEAMKIIAELEAKVAAAEPGGSAVNYYRRQRPL